MNSFLSFSSSGGQKGFAGSISVYVSEKDLDKHASAKSQQALTIEYAGVAILGKQLGKLEW